MAITNPVQDAGQGVCPSCHEPVPAGARFCEGCGSELGPMPLVAGPSGGASAMPVDRGVAAVGPTGSCVSCGAPAEQIDADRYCQLCGRKQPALHDHEEVVLPGVVAVTDRGITHHRNEDAFACGVADGVVVVMVSDGVSSTADSDAAAIGATAAARDHALAALVAGDDVVSAVRGAMATAQVAAAAVPPSTGETASCTAVFFAARRVDDRTWCGAVAWLGDSRAYWLGSSPTREGSLEPLTVDHSWATEAIANGMAPVDAFADARSHSITRWLGADAVDTEPSVREIALAEGDTVLVVSDGLWNYVPDTTSFAALLAERGRGATIESVRALVAFANEQGGHDNITVATATF